MKIFLDARILNSLSLIDLQKETSVDVSQITKKFRTKKIVNPQYGLQYIKVLQCLRKLFIDIN